MTARERRQAWFRGGQPAVDVLVVGGGVVGAGIYRRLALAGHRVLLVERGDLGSGASQGSANLVWGGLLYLARGRVDEVWRWTHARDRLLADPASGVQPLPCAYRPDPARRSPLLVRAALLGYWALGGCRGPFPRARDGLLHFREGLLTQHDARRAWSRAAGVPGTVLNWCAPTAATARPGGWDVALDDRLDGLRTTVRCAMVVNAAGAWAGGVDALAGIDHGWDIVPSRGVSLVVAGRRDHALMVEHPDERDMLSLVPYPGADAAIWGSTETLTDVSGALEPSDDDIVGLIRLHRRLVGPLSRRDLLAVRCGVRALAVKRGTTARRSQDLTRSFRVLGHDSGWITILGGKLTGARAVADAIAGQVSHRLGCRAPAAAEPPAVPPAVRLPGLDLDLPDPAWCREHEQCWTLESWLRRRTPLAQIVPRGGLGWEDEHQPQLADLAERLLGAEGAAALAAHAAAVAAEDARLARLFALADGSTAARIPA
jgi:glycerol-3-phosphate dehydrogenase